MTRFESIRILLALATVKNYEISQFNIKTVFLYGDLKEEIFNQQDLMMTAIEFVNSKRVYTMD